jgi:hypothetical protein
VLCLHFYPPKARANRNHTGVSRSATVAPNRRTCG